MSVNKMLMLSQIYGGGAKLPAIAEGDEGKVLTVSDELTPEWADIPDQVPTYDSLVIDTPPTKTSYTYGETFDPTGMVVKAQYVMGGIVVGTKTVTDYTYSSALAVGQTGVVISYTENDITRTATQPISVSKATPNAPTLSESKVTLDAETPSATVTVTRQGDGAVQAVSTDTAVVTASVSGNVVTIMAVDPSTSASATVNITVAEGTNYFAYSTNVPISVSVGAAGGVYGVSWDGTSTTSWTRTDDAALFTDPVPYVLNATEYGSPFDTISPWQDMTIVEDAEAGTMVKIPKFWYLLEQSGAGMSIKISPTEQTGYSVCPACMDRGDGNGEHDYVLVGRYHCGDGSNSTTAYKSVTGVTPQTNITRSAARTAIHALGTNVWQWDWATRFTIWLLYLVEYANWNSQATLGYGCGNNSSKQAVGASDSMPYHTGTMQVNKTTYGVGVQYRHIEGLWDNVYDWLDGCYNASSGLNIILNPANFSDSTGGVSVGTPSSGYPSAFTVHDESGTYPLFIPSAASGSNSTYSADLWFFSASYPCVYCGGNYSQALDYGLFCFGYGGAYGSGGFLGSRSLKTP